MERIGILLDDVFREHHCGPGHPERPPRLDAVVAGLESAALLQGVARIAPTLLDDAALHRLHPAEYVDRVRAACEARRPVLDEPDCGICPESYRVARLAAGGVVDAARRIARGEFRRAFCAVRPPGHHAERDRAMGFCLLGNVALAAAALRDELGFERIAIIDWDVHHGNGTQHLLEVDPHTFFVSLHGHPATLYPGSGFEEETGIGAGAGFTLNLPLLPGTGDAEYRTVFEKHAMARLDAFKPQFVIVSAGFDAHLEDPLGNLALTDETFRWLTRQVIQLANVHAQGRLLSVLEGGYNLGVMKRCVAEHVEELQRT